jgi:xylan 1,4-beta-xylosidase
VFEEQGVVRRPFYGGYGLIAAGGIPKPAFNAFKMLHQLGTERLESDSEHALITRRANGSLVIALWNYVAPGGSGSPNTMVLRLPPGSPHSARVLRLDADHGDVAGTYARLGSPIYPTHDQLAQLRQASSLSAESVAIVGDRLSLTLPPNGLATIEVTSATRVAH